MERYDVVVVGAGLAGLQCTRLLAGHGLRVLLADRKAALDEAVHTTGIFVRRSLEDFALPSAFLGPAIRRVRVYSPARRVSELTSEHDEFRIGQMGPLYTRLLKDCQAAGAHWLPGTTFVSCEPAEPGSTVTLKTNGVDDRVHTRFVIGGDGTNSRVARQLNLSENRRWLVGVEEVYEHADSQGPPALHCFFDRRVAPGYIAWVADDGRSVHVGVGGYAERFQPSQALERFRASLGSIVQLRSAQLIERRAGRIPVGGVLPRIANPRGLLLGDAAGAVSPLTAGGLDPCLRLSELAAKVTWKYLQTGDAAALAPYDGQLFRRRFRARRTLRAIYDLAGYNVLMEIGAALVRLGPAERILRHIFFGRGSFPDTTFAPAAAAKSVASG